MMLPYAFVSATAAAADMPSAGFRFSLIAATYYVILLLIAC